MAKKKKHATKRVGGGGKTMTMLTKYAPIIGGAAGFFLGDKVNDKIDQAVGTKIDTKLIAAGQVGLGAALVFRKGKKNLVTGLLGGFAMGTGAKRALKAFGMGGFYNVPGVNGFYDVKAVNGHKRVAGPLPAGGSMNFNSRAAMNGSMMYNGGAMMR